MREIKDLNKFRDQFVRWTLRRASFRWPPRGEAMKAARVGRGTYLCAECKLTFSNKEVRLDHKEPVVPIVQYMSEANAGVGKPQFDVNSYVLRLLCGSEGLQVLCTQCHSIKTRRENEQRAEAKRLAKGLKSNNGHSKTDDGEGDSISRKGRTRTKGRRGKANVAPTAVEGGGGGSGNS